MSEPNQTGLSDNVAGMLAYLTFIPAIIFLLVEPYDRNSYVRFHAWQCIFLCIATFAIDLVLTVAMGIAFAFTPYLQLAIWPMVQLCWVIIWIMRLLNAINGKRFKLPVIGELAAQQVNK